MRLQISRSRIIAIFLLGFFVFFQYLGGNYLLADEAAPSQADDLVLWLKCDDDVDDGIVTDSSIYNNDGACVGDVIFDPAEGHDGSGAYILDGGESSGEGWSRTFVGGDCITLPDSENLTVTSHTQAAWVKPNYDASFNAIFAMDGSVLSGFRDNNDLTKIAWRNAAGKTKSITHFRIPSEKWTHVVFVFDVKGDDVTISYYLDGLPIISKDYSGGFMPQSIRFIGASSAGNNPNPLNGMIDDLRIYNRALCPIEVQQLAKGEEPLVHMIRVTSTINGSVDPKGEVYVADGGNQLFTIMPELGYHVSDVLVNGISKGPILSYEFLGVTEDQSIHAEFALGTQIFTITAAARANGTIQPKGRIDLDHGQAQTFTIQPDEGYKIGYVLVDGKIIKTVPNYTFTNISANHEIEVYFSIPPTAIDDTLTVNEDAIDCSLDVLANDYDTESDTIAVSRLTNSKLPYYGTAKIAENGASILYTPNADFTGSDFINYEIIDSKGATATAKVNITVIENEINDKPVALDDVNSIMPNTSDNKMHVLRNDKDPDKNELSVAGIETLPSHGKAVISADGKDILYTPDSDYSGFDMFEYAVSDTCGKISKARIIVNVLDKDGWSVFKPSADTQIIYVSSSEGDDANDGLSEANPVKSLDVAYAMLRDGYPDWLLLKRGDVWEDASFKFNGWADTSGRSPIEPQLIGAYGSAIERPRVEFGEKKAAMPAHGNEVSYVAIVGIEFINPRMDPASLKFDGSRNGAISIASDGDWYFIEDVKARFGTIGVANAQRTNFIMRRCVILDSYSTTSHAQGTFIQGVHVIRIEENVFDHNGWNEDFDLIARPGTVDPTVWASIKDGRFRARVNYVFVDFDNIDFSGVTTMDQVASVLENAINAKTGIPNGVKVYWRNAVLLFIASINTDPRATDFNRIGAYEGVIAGTDLHGKSFLNGPGGDPNPTQFNHNLYITSHGNEDLVFTNNIVSRGSGSGIQARLGGWLENNLFIRNNGSFVGRTSSIPVPGGVKGACNNNVFMEAEITSLDDTSRGGDNFEVQHADEFLVDGNIFTRALRPELPGRSLQIGSAHEGINNLTVSNNIFYDGPQAIGTCLYDTTIRGHINIVDNIIVRYFAPLGASGWKKHVLLDMRREDTTHRFTFADNVYWNAADRVLFTVEGADVSTFDKWVALTGDNSVVHEPKFVDPNRSVATYVESLGIGTTYDDFMNQARNQSKSNWQNAFTAKVVNDYIREGFKLTDTPPQPSPKLVSAVSRKAHGSAGEFDIALPLSYPESATDSRKDSSLKLVLTFSDNIMAADGSLDANEIGLSSGALNSATITNNKMTVVISNVIDQAVFGITLSGIVNKDNLPLEGDNDLHIRILYGDTNKDGSTDLVDMMQIKSKDQAALNNDTCCFDINVDGRINLIDMALAKSMNGAVINNDANAIEEGVELALNKIETTAVNNSTYQYDNNIDDKIDLIDTAPAKSTDNTVINNDAYQNDVNTESVIEPADDITLVENPGINTAEEAVELALNKIEAAMVSPAPEAAPSQADDLVLWLRCDDDVDDGIVTDSSIYNNDGACVGDVIFDPAGGHDGSGAYKLDGGDYITLPASEDLKVTSHTQAAWVKLTYDGTWSMIFNAGNNLYTGFLNNNDLIRSKWMNAAGVVRNEILSTKIPPEGVWTHVAFVYDVNGDNVTVTYYKDGIAESSKSFTDGFMPQAITLIGTSPAWNKSNDLNGLIDDLRIYNRALHPVEVEQLAKGAELLVHTIRVTSTIGGSIDPNGEVYVGDGNNQLFTIIPELGYHVSDVLVNGIPQGPISSYEFINVTEDQAIHAEFSKGTQVYVITATTGANGTIEPQGEITVDHGKAQAFNIKPAPGYEIEYIRVDGEDVEQVSRYYQFRKINGDHEIEASFRIPLPLNIVLDIPTPSAQRMDPAPVFASIDFNNSSIGAGGWSQARILWSVEREGGLESWPDKYRYVIDPRPGLDNKKIDLSGRQFKEGNYNGPRGFNMAWMLTEGRWTIKANITNINGESIEALSNPIVITANSRTKIYVDSNKGIDKIGRGADSQPYASLAYALKEHSGLDNYEYLIAGGHEEIVPEGTQLMTGGAINNYIHWDRQGARPRLIDDSMKEDLARIAMSSESEVWEGLDLIPNYGSQDGPSADPFVFERGGSFSGFIDLHMPGTYDGNRFSSLFALTSSNTIIQSNEGGVTGGYSVATGDGDTSHIAVIGNSFNDSVHESVIRVMGSFKRPWDRDKINVLYSRLDSGGSKSTIRYLIGNYLHAYGNYLLRGDFRFGNQFASMNPPVWQGRVEANYFGGTNNGGGQLGFMADLHDAVAANNIFVRVASDDPVPSTSGIGGTFSLQDRFEDDRGAQDPYWIDVSENISILGNTYLWNVPERSAISFWSGYTTPADVALFHGNLIVVSEDYNKAQMRTHTITISSYKDNVWTPVEDYKKNRFINTQDGDLSLSEWQSLAETENERAISTSLNSKFESTPSTQIATPPGIYDDYYGNPRGATSAAGAVVESADTPPQPSPKLISAVSRKAHGSAGEFDIALPLSYPESATDSRRDSSLKLVLTFSKNIMAADGELDANEIGLSSGALNSATITNNKMTVVISNVIDQAVFGITLSGIVNKDNLPLEGDNDLHIRILYGDTNKDGSTDLVDMMQIKSKDQAALNNDTCCFDINVDGSINLIDMALAKSMNGSACPLD